MDQFIRIALPVYFICYFAVAFVLKSAVVARRIGKNPLVLPKDDSAYGLIGFYFKLTMIALGIYVCLYAFFPEWHKYFLPIHLFNGPFFVYIGILLLAFSLIWTIIAQLHMKDSWRIGIDHEVKTELIITGLFRISRNPIFFGLLISLAGLILITPNSITIGLFILSYVLIQIQIRLEEEFLEQAHGQEYLDYKGRVRRFL